MKTNRKKRLFSAIMFGFVTCLAGQSQTINLCGKWKFAIGDKPSYTDEIVLPGSMLTNDKGNDVTVNTRWTGSLYDSSFFFNPYMEKYRIEGKMKFPFFLTPSKHYTGNAWYARTVQIPKTWKKRRVMLFLERPHITTTIFVNGKEAGRDSSLSVPHEFDITPYIVYGKDNDIAIRIGNDIKNVCVGQDSHSVTDQTQGNWNGIVGDILLQARQQEYIDNVQVYPDVEQKQIKVVANVVGKCGKHDFRFIVDGQEYLKKGLLTDGDGNVTAVIPMGQDVKLWDEFSPNLYQLTTVMGTDTVCTTFGMSQISIQGRQFYMNGKKIWMRGTVENCCFPETGYPPTDVDSWVKIFKKCKEYGLNMMRFHSYCPPEAAFIAADKTGFYLQPEGPSWPNHGVNLGRGMSIDRYLLEETQRMVRKYGNHPSFCMLAAGNEPAGNWVKWVGDFVDYWKSTGDKRRVYCGASVGGGWAWDAKSQYHVKGGARGLDWNNKAPQSVDNFNEAVVKVTQKGSKPITFDVNEPLLTHEMGQWCAFPDLKETTQYTGAYKAYNFDIFRDLLRDNGMALQAERFLHASGKLQTLAYKYDLERNLRTRDYAGFQLLGLNDYSGQGTALVGVLNVHWREKGYCSAEDWTEFCSPIVPLAKFPKFVYNNGETLSVDVEMYNAGEGNLKGAKTKYRIYDAAQHEYFSGLLSDKSIDLGKNMELGCINIALSQFVQPVKLTLEVYTTVANSKKPIAKNHWDFWVYPLQMEMPQTKDVYIADSFDTKVQRVLEKGGKVLLLAAGKVKMGADVKQYYLPVFWNTSWFKMRPPHTTGAWIDVAHPLFKNFPTDDWGNLNWWELLNKAQVMNLRELPADYQPAIQPIDTWHVSRKLGMMIEANVGKGKLFMTTMDISSDLEHRLVARQMRKAILTYMSGNDFNPTLSLDSQIVSDFFTKSAPEVNMFTKDSPDELKPKLKCTSIDF